GAEALARAVSDPRSHSSYRHYLTPAQFRAQFAPTVSQVTQVQNWLTSQGFTLVYTPANNHYVSAKGTVGQAQAAFGIDFGMYNANGLTLRSPSADVSIPVRSLASLAASSGSIKAPYLFVRIMWWTPTRRRPPVSETRLRYRFTGRNISQVWPYRRTPPRQQHQGILSLRGLQMSLSRPCRGQSRDTRPSKSKAHTVSLELT